MIFTLLILLSFLLYSLSFVKLNPISLSIRGPSVLCDFVVTVFFKKEETSLLHFSGLSLYQFKANFWPSPKDFLGIFLFRHNFTLQVFNPLGEISRSKP
jgi:hypothetical protein